MLHETKKTEKKNKEDVLKRRKRRMRRTKNSQVYKTERWFPSAGLGEVRLDGHNFVK